MKDLLFQGTCPALVTPFRQGKVDEEALYALTDWQIREGVSAVVACGTTGEASTLSEAEWLKVSRIVIEAAKRRVPVIVGTGGNNTAEVIHKAGLAKGLGADAQMCVTPYYNKTTQRGLVAHYQAIAESSDLPIVLYNVPGRTALSIAPTTLSQLADLPQIIGIKEATADLALAADMMRLCEDRMAFYTGSDEVIMPFMALGGQGVISVVSNIAPRQTSQLTGLMLRGEVHAAAQAQKELMPLIRLLFTEVNPIPVKAGLALMGQCEDSPRLPLVPLSEGNRSLLRDEMTRLGLL